MRQTVATILAFFLVSTVTKAQSWRIARFELYGGVTAMQYYGDIGGSPDVNNLGGLKDFDITKVRPGFSGGVRYLVKGPWQVGINYSSGWLTGSDLNSKNPTRAFAFSTLVNEVSVRGEYYIIPENTENMMISIMQVRGGLKQRRKPWSLYVFLGAGGLHAKVWPQDSLVTSARFNDQKPFGFVFPAGIGFKYVVVPGISVGAEVCIRHTTSNTLDGYDSPFSKFNDIYNNVVFSASYKLRKLKRPNARPPSRRFFKF